LAVNGSNPVIDSHKGCFDQKITNWSELGGKDEPIVLFRTGDITDYYTEEELGENFVNFPDKINDLI
jgi:phosphate transport system permease protein